MEDSSLGHDMGHSSSLSLDPYGGSRTCFETKILRPNDEVWWVISGNDLD